MGMIRKLKCWLGLHDWKTVIGTYQYVSTTLPSCKYCDARYYMTQLEINEWWEIQAQIQKLKQRQRDLKRNSPYER